MMMSGLTINLCLFKQFLGIPCPGCGLTRAFLAFFQGNWQLALYYHPLFWLVPFIFLVVLFRKKVPLFQKLLQKNWFLWGMVVLFLSVYMGRLFLYFPNQAPMDFYQGSLLGRVIHIVGSLI